MSVFHPEVAGICKSLNGLNNFCMTFWRPFANPLPVNHGGELFVIPPQISDCLSVILEEKIFVIINVFHEVILVNIPF